MKGHPDTQKMNKRYWTLVGVLLLCVVLTSSLLFSRLISYIPEDKQLYIPLTESNRITKVAAQNSSLSAAPTGRMLAIMPLTARPGFTASDDNTVWEGQTEVDIFKISYNGTNGEITVRSQDGKKVLAPGTSNLYRFALHNTGNVSLDYTMSMEAYFSNEEYAIPVIVRVTDWQGNYLAGSAESKDDVLALNDVAQAGVIAAGNIYAYTLEWEWPFESGDDAYDTMLGNLAVDQDITLTIVINTTAEGSTDPDQPGGTPPQTGDTTMVALLATLMVASMAGIMVILLLRSKKDKKENETA